MLLFFFRSEKKKSGTYLFYIEEAMFRKKHDKKIRVGSTPLFEGRFPDIQFCIQHD